MTIKQHVNKAPKNIYLADDDDDDRATFIDAIKELPISSKITVFENGVDLMADLLNKEKQLPNFIFLDLHMPMMNGEECLADIRNEPDLAHLPIIIYSGDFDQFKVELLHKKGADRYLQKPMLFNQLKDCLQKTFDSFEQSPLKIVPEQKFIIR